MSKMADKFFRLVSFVVNICPEPLRKMFLKYAKADKGTTFTTLDDYLTFRETDIRRCRKLRNDQENLLYPNGSKADEWDVSLLTTLITELFGSCISMPERGLIDEIREKRNSLQHLPNTSSITDQYYNQFWTELETATLGLARHTDGPAYEMAILVKIDEIRSDDVQNIGDVLRIWYDECIREMNDRMEQMQTKMSEMSAIMQKVTIQTPGPTGGKNKRIKTVDSILQKLKANFETTMKTELRNNFDPPSEVAGIRTLLRDKHHVVVAGSFSSRYLESALFAITTMDYTEGRCVEISTSSDWRHIDPEDVDLVLLKDPFGKDYYESSKAKGIADVFNNMLQTSKEDTDADRIDIILVTEIGILAEVRKQHDHDILDIFVNVFDATTEKQPADLTLGPDISIGAKAPLNQVASNLKEMTSTFIQHYYSDLNRIQVDDAYIKIAKEKFKRSKIVVLVGPKEYGKVLAVALASFYKPSRCLLLTKPDDTLLIDSDVCLAIVDQFAGKYRFSEDQVLKWYDMFDHLQLAVEAGKLNVVITCEKEKLKGCRKIFSHPLLEHTVDLPEDDYNAVKNEVSLEENVEMSDTMDHSTEQTENEHQKRHKKLRRNGYGETPVHIAAKKPHPDELKKYIASGADVNVRDNANWSPLHDACNKGLVENAACLLQAGADIDALGDENYTPLHKASMSGNIELVQMLLDRGAKPELRNDDGQSPMDVAFSSDIYTLIEAAVNRNVSVDMSMTDTIHDGI